MLRKKWFWIGLLILFLLFFCPQLASYGAQDNPPVTPKKDTKKPAKKPKEDPGEIGNRDVGKGVNLYSLEKEIALGKQLATEVEKNAKIITDPTIAEYVNRLGQNIVRSSDAKVPFTIKVIDSQEVNAFALPGGFFFVNTGLILKAETEAELAGVMAHEIAHVAARHGTKQSTKGQIVNYATIPLIFVGGGIGTIARAGTSVLVPVAFLKFSRAMEEQADDLGLQYIYAAGYDPTAFIDFFERIESMEKKKPGTLAKVFSSHPMTDSRIKRTQKEIETFDAKPEYVVNTSEFNDVKALLERQQNRRKGAPEPDSNRPTLKRNTTDPIGDDEKKPKTDQDERPTLKRRDGGAPEK
jgi:predicted Zn-dependent protease